MIKRLLKSNGWHLFCAFYMAAVVAYIIYFAATQHILMAGFMISTFFMLGIELYLFASGCSSSKAGAVKC
ncbi:MAG: hypothetical protein J5685_09855 [Clostridiales bacterium]|nr:hypothetical protein [Clostridiales bacterium]